MGCCDQPGLLPIEQAITQMLASVSSVTEIETIALDKALGRITAKAIYSPMQVPPFANSAMDGYAFRLQDIDAMSAQPMPVAGKSFAGQPFVGEWPAQSAIRIMTGAPIPAGCDCVIMQEDCQVDDSGMVRITLAAEKIKAGMNIRPAGDDIDQGDLVIEAGVQLSARELPMLASLGIAQIDVYRQPVIAFFSTGDELKSVGSPLGAGEIYDSNRFGIAALLTRMGLQGLDLGMIPDDIDALRQTFMEAMQKADAIITSGGVSVGEADYTKDILQELGEVGFWKIAIKPGKPFAFGKLHGETKSTLFFGLPGNPVSAMVTLHQIAQPALAKLAGHDHWRAPLTLKATTRSNFKKRPGRTDYQRAILSQNSAGELEVESTGNQSSGAFRSMHLANAFVILEQERGFVAQGETVTVMPFDSTLQA
ncbi:Molybdopterin molybdenumtransferase [Vibrio stylophorae]|uniref:Molybdopterin molybdenumtransferase n=1 Tax=Vibrio stylophorae TaxID=659351 RepID=A0ABN8DT40_9VIBR|nr:molybdopterin molybdotransferase MoeA [Vibrio stylophorae]CAH0533723.1 Molybdopterin molybdenumtransferase [Vibrio stylophorae]